MIIVIMLKVDKRGREMRARRLNKENDEERRRSKENDIIEQIETQNQVGGQPRQTSAGKMKMRQKWLQKVFWILWILLQLFCIVELEFLNCDLQSKSPKKPGRLPAVAKMSIFFDNKLLFQTSI